MAKATEKQKTKEERFDLDEARPLKREPASELSAEAIIRKRRSAVAFDGKTGITKAQFISILDKTIPRKDHAPFDVVL